MPNNDPIIGQILLQVFLVFLNAVFASAEIAVISMNDNKLARLVATGDKRAIRLSKLTEQPSKFLATIQIGITLVNLLGSAFAADNFSDRLAEGLANLGIRLPMSVLDTLSLVIITLVLTYVTVSFGELIPKRIAMKKAEQLALSMSWLIYIVSKVFASPVWLLTVSANGILKLLGFDPKDEDDENTEEEIRMMVDVGSEKGTILPEEKYMIQNIFEFNDIEAEEIMTHRTEVVLLWLDESMEDWDKLISESHHSIYPVCEESPDNIIGILHTKDYYRLKEKTRENILQCALKPAYFIPETVKADVLFRNMKKTHNHFAIVLDEYGGMSGIITIFDLLEQIVGDLESDISLPNSHPYIERVDEKTWRIQGMTPLENVAKELSIHLPVEDYDTFGGLVFGILGTVPDDGTAPELQSHGMEIKIKQIKEHRLIYALVHLIENKRSNAEVED